MRCALTAALIVTPSVGWGQSCLTGRVVDAATNQAVAAVAISAAWSAHKDRVQITKQTTSDSSGRWQLCLKGGSSALLTATLGGRSAYFPIVAPSVDSTLGDLRLSVEGDTGSAIVAGRVVSDAGTPIAGATVTILGEEGETLTTSDGGFGLRAPAGSQVLIVRRLRLGAAVVPVDLSPQAPRVVNVTMQRAPTTLAVVDVVADRLQIALVYAAIGFWARQKLGHGHFMTVEDIENRNLPTTADLFRGIPGVRLSYDHNNVLRVYPDQGAGTLRSYGDCTAYFVDGALIGNGRAVYTEDAGSEVPNSPEDEEQLPPPKDLIGIEVYLPNEPAPIVAGGVDRCLKIVLWTRAKLDRR